jgi:hypothetical protein
MAPCVSFVLTLLQIAVEEDFVSVIKSDLRTVGPIATQSAGEENENSSR